MADNPLITQLGFANQDKLLIVHADDLGLNESTNLAAINAFTQGFINSASIMVPTPQFLQIAMFAKMNPQYDLGLHITMTAEWQKIKWGGVAPASKITSLLDKAGNFYPSTEQFVQFAKTSEVEIEFRAQIEKAIASGIKPSHLDSHMGALFQNEQLFSLYLKMGREYKIPVVLPLNFISGSPNFMALLNDNERPIDNYFFINEVSKDTSNKEWLNKYNHSIEGMKAAEVAQITLHLGTDNKDMRDTVGEGFNYGSRWRQQDFNYVSHPNFSDNLIKQGVTRVTWRDIQKVSYPAIIID